MVAKKVVRATSAVSIMGGTRRGRAAASWQGAVAASSGAAGDDGAVPCAMVERGKRGRRHAAGDQDPASADPDGALPGGPRRPAYAVAPRHRRAAPRAGRSEEPTSELQSLMRNS